jgi:serine protease AprX
MRQFRANASGDRSNALWGRGSRGEARSNALWGRGGRRAGAALLTTFAVMIAMAALAVASPHSSAGGNHGGLKAYVEDSLLASVQQDPKQSFDVIVQGDPAGKASGLLSKLLTDTDGDALRQGNIKTQFSAIDGLQATLTGKQILHLARAGLVTSIMANEATAASAVQLPNYNTQLWSYSTGAVVDWTNAALPKLPTIAVVDSGIDTSKTSDFGSRIIGSFNFVTPGGSVPNSPGDGYGHGTFVAGIAAGSAAGYAGVAPKANILSLDVMNDQGMASVADVLKACDWLLANRVAYNIKVANFSLHAVNRASVLFDPLDQAVEKLWLSGIFVVAASGNYAHDGQASGVPYAPGNDPFVMTVGAADIGTTVATTDDTVAPWSAWGYTPDGFSKPDMAGPGRYIVGPVPANGVLPQSRPSDVVAPGYMQLSGTSFSAPMVAGAAAMLLDKNPSWTPDQLKGALMMTASPVPSAPKGSLGVGELNIPVARKLNPNAVLPNPNAGLNQFITTTLDGTKVFNAAAWESAAKSNVAWDSAAWSDAAWSSAAWSSAAWSDAAWSDAAWASAAWGTAAWSDAAWSDAAWSDAAWADNAGDDAGDTAEVGSSQADALIASFGITDPNCDPTLTVCSSTTTTTTAVLP